MFCPTKQNGYNSSLSFPFTVIWNGRLLSLNGTSSFCPSHALEVRNGRPKSRQLKASGLREALSYTAYRVHWELQKYRLTETITYFCCVLSRRKYEKWHVFFKWIQSIGIHTSIHIYGFRFPDKHVFRNKQKHAHTPRYTSARTNTQTQAHTQRCCDSRLSYSKMRTEKIT
jgi:hypothetical protein